MSYLRFAADLGDIGAQEREWAEKEGGERGEGARGGRGEHQLQHGPLISERSGFAQNGRICSGAACRADEAELGFLLSKGSNGIKKDMKEAARWYRMAVSRVCRSVDLASCRSVELWRPVRCSGAAVIIIRIG